MVSREFFFDWYYLWYVQTFRIDPPGPWIKRKRHDNTPVSSTSNDETPGRGRDKCHLSESSYPEQKTPQLFWVEWQSLWVQTWMWAISDGNRRTRNRRWKIFTLHYMWVWSAKVLFLVSWRVGVVVVVYISDSSSFFKKKWTTRSHEKKKREMYRFHIEPWLGHRHSSWLGPRR